MADPHALPTGTVTFLFTDIEGSTQLSQRYPDAFPSGMPVAQFFEPDARAALADAEEVIRFVGATLGSP